MSGVAAALRAWAGLLDRVAGRIERSAAGGEPSASRKVNRAAADAIAEHWRRKGARIGRNVRITQDLDHVNPHLVSIGHRCVIGGVLLAHGPGDKPKRVGIGDNVYIGRNAQVLPGIEIGDNCIVGAGAVVTRSVPAGHVVAGNPARVLRKVREDELRSFIAQMDADEFIGGEPWPA